MHGAYGNMAELWEKVLAYDYEREVVELTRNLIAIPSVSGQEKAIGKFLRSTMENMGLEVEFQEARKDRPNVIGRVLGKSGKPGLLLNGHMDTIPVGDMEVDPFGGVVEGGRIYGRGAVDMKGAIAAMVVAAALIKRAGVELDKDLIVAAVSGEEAFKNRAGGIGTRYMVKKGIDASAAIVGEATNLDIGIAHIGLMFINIICKGRGVHSVDRDRGVNAILKMVKVINALQELGSRLELKRHKLLGRPPVMNIGIIHGGTLHNWVPDLCRLGIDRRLIPGETVEEALQQINELVERLRREDSDLTVTFKPRIANRGMEISPDEAVVLAIQKARGRVLGSYANLVGIPYGTDAAILVNEARIPTAIMGPGDFKLLHSRVESVGVKELVDAVKIYTHTALTMCQHSYIE